MHDPPTTWPGSPRVCGCGAAQDVVRRLIRHGVDVDDGGQVRATDGVGALTRATPSHDGANHLGLWFTMAHRGMTLTTPDRWQVWVKDGVAWTPLHLAAYHGFGSVVEILWRCGSCGSQLFMTWRAP